MTFSNYVYDVRAIGFQADEILFNSVNLNSSTDVGVEFLAKVQWKLLKKAPTDIEQYKAFAHMYKDVYYRFININ
tara:strand:+ start:434 stop:658 length:225 start_codon:yes stop_codon:yes gene_type:complete